MTESLIFLHLGKTAGMTLASIIRRQYPENRLYKVYSDPAMAAVDRFAALPEDERAYYRAIIGHMHLGMHKLIPGPSTYITVLRDPVERVISAYYYVLERPTHPDHAKIRQSGLDFAGVLDSGLLPILDNSQVQVLCTTDVPDIPYGGCTSDMLEEAKRNIDRRFAVVGLTERFDETLLMMKDRFGWKNVYYARRNPTRRRPRRQDLSAEVLELVRAHNRLDIELYAYARERFEQEVDRLGVRFRRRVRAFRRANVAANLYRRFRAQLHA